MSSRAERHRAKALRRKVDGNNLASWRLGARFFSPAFAALLLLLLSIPVFPPPLPAQDPAVTYPAAGNLRLEQGTIELWFRLEDDPDGSQRNTLHYFPFFRFDARGEKQPRASLVYQTIWKPDWFHFFFSSLVQVMNERIAGQYVTTVEEGQVGVKADYSRQGAYPRTPRLKKGEWHSLAFTWTNGLAKATVAMHFDGREAIRAAELPGPWLDNLDATSLVFLSAPNHDNIALDELRVSGMARSPLQITNDFARGAFLRDEHTLLLDHFDRIETNETTKAAQTLAEQVAGYHDEKGGQVAGRTELIEGRFGKALRILK